MTVNDSFSLAMRTHPDDEAEVALPEEPAEAGSMTAALMPSMRDKVEFAPPPQPAANKVLANAAKRDKRAGEEITERGRKSEASIFAADLLRAPNRAACVCKNLV